MAKKAREWIYVSEMLEASDVDDPPSSDGLRGYRIFRPPIAVTHMGATRQLTWAINNWIRPYLNRVRQGIDYDPTLHRPPQEPDWLRKDERGRGLLQTRLKTPYGDDWETHYARQTEKRRGRKQRAAQRARD